MKAHKTVDVILNIKGKDTPRKLGYTIRKRPAYVNYTWIETDEEQVIFGVIDKTVDYLTHMSYENYSHDTWREWLDDLRVRRGLDKFYFDAGGNGCPVYIKMDKLEEAMQALGLFNCQKCSHSNNEHRGVGRECEFVIEMADDYIKHCECAGYQEVGA